MEILERHPLPWTITTREDDSSLFILDGHKDYPVMICRLWLWDMNIAEVIVNAVNSQQEIELKK